MTKSISKKIIRDTVKINVKNALNEDHVFDDNTTELLNNKIVGDAFIRSNQKCILCGIPWANECFKQINAKIKIEWLVEEGISIKKNQKICFIRAGKLQKFYSITSHRLFFFDLLNAKIIFNNVGFWRNSRGGSFF